MECDLRNLRWRPSSWATYWMSSEELGIAIGTRNKRSTSSGLGRFDELSDEQVAKFGFKDFPVRLEIAPGEQTTDCLVTLMAIPRKFSERKSLPGEDRVHTWSSTYIERIYAYTIYVTAEEV